MNLDTLTILIFITIIVLFIILKKYKNLVSSYSYIGMKYIKKNKVAKSAKYLKSAADKGDPVCAYNLGVLYMQGDAVLFNKKEAVKYLHMAHSNAGKGDFKVPEYKKKTDPREAQNKRIKKIIKTLWKEEELWRLEGDTNTVLNY